MSLSTEIISKEGYKARVTANGELVVGNLEYSEPYYVLLDVDDQIYNIVPGKVNKKFIVVGILIGANRNVTTDTAVHVYEATSEEGASEKDILNITILRSEHTYLNLKNLTTQQTRWINATADDDDVDLTIFGYYVDAN